MYILHVLALFVVWKWQIYSQFLSDGSLVPYFQTNPSQKNGDWSSATTLPCVLMSLLFSSPAFSLKLQYVEIIESHHFIHFISIFQRLQHNEARIHGAIEDLAQEQWPERCQTPDFFYPKRRVNSDGGYLTLGHSDIYNYHMTYKH